MTGGGVSWTVAISLAVGACVGGLIGTLAALLWRAGRESAQRVDAQTLREHLTQQQLDASLALQARESAIESLVQPIRETLARTATELQSIERDRIDAFA
ncbi:MAG TPA: hypothetical protein VKP66_19425, partial [Steroidobacteraceae bacterium]|nr:hypothetical protein [Steroidobacteraceae bacterium]